MLENKSYTTIPSEEYKELVLKEKELEDTQILSEYNEYKINNLKDEIVKIGDELKELLLNITNNTTHTRYTYQTKIEGHEMAPKDTIVDYINKNYVDDSGNLQFRKIEKEEVETNE